MLGDRHAINATRGFGMKKALGTLALLIATGAHAAPEVFLEPGEPGETDKTLNFAYAVKSTSTPFRWVVRIKSTEFNSVTPGSLVIQDVANNTSRSITLGSTRFIDKVVHVCTFSIGTTCYYTSPVNYKFAYGVEYLTPTRDTQTYKATFNYTPSGGAATTASSSTQTVGGMDRFCGGTGYDLGMLRSVPTGTPPAGGWPAVVLMHGGYWKDRSAKDMITYANDLKNAGYYVINVTYRLTPDRGRFNAYFNISHPTIEWTEFKALNTLDTLKVIENDTINATGTHLKDTVSDVKCAVRYLRSQASTLSVNPNKIALMGFSAGAHMSMLAGLTSDGPVADWENKGGYTGVSPAVKAVVSMAGPSGRFAELYTKFPKDIVCDFRAAFRLNRDTCYENGSIPVLTSADAATFATYEPINSNYVNKSINAGMPLLMLQGAKDSLLNALDTSTSTNSLLTAMVNAMNNAAANAGKTGNAHGKVYSNGAHDDFNGAGLCAAEASTAAIAFLNAYVKGSGSPSEIQTFTNTLATQSSTCN